MSLNSFEAMALVESIRGIYYPLNSLGNSPTPLPFPFFFCKGFSKIQFGVSEYRKFLLKAAAAVAFSDPEYPKTIIIWKQEGEIDII